MKLLAELDEEEEEEEEEEDCPNPAALFEPNPNVELSELDELLAADEEELLPEEDEDPEKTALGRPRNGLF